MELGDKVKTTARLDRRTRSAGEGRGWNRKQWERTNHEEKQGVFIGTRTLQNGTRFWESECGWCWDKESHFEAALVVFNERQSPVHVPLDAVTKVNQ